MVHSRDFATALADVSLDESAVVLASAITRALEIEELLSSILERLEKRYLISCACVCRRWETTSLRLLWAEPKASGVRHLFDLLEPRQPQGLIQDEKWNRFHRYASLVRFLDIAVREKETSKSRRAIPRRAINDARFAASMRGQHLFESAERVSIQPMDVGSAKTAIGFIAESRRNLTLNWQSVIGAADNELLLSALTKMRYCSPLLSSLTVRLNSNHNTDFISTLASTLDNLPRLEVLSLPSDVMLHPTIWNSCRRLAALRVMGDVAMPSVDAFTETPLTLACEGFSSLQQFACALPFFKVSQIFNRNTRGPLKEVALRLIGNARQKIIEHTISIICANVPTLEHLIVSFVGSYTLSMSDFMPHCRPEVLSTLSVHTERASSLTDDDFKALAEAVPNIRILAISPHPTSSPSHPPASLRSLGHIARHCREINVVALYIRAGQEQLPNDDGLGVFSNTLHTLNFGLSNFSNGYTLSVARLLVNITPSSAPCIVSETMRGAPLRPDLSESIKWRISLAKERWKLVSDMVSQLRSTVP